MEHEYASNGKGNLGVTLGAIGTGLGVLGGGLNGLNLFGNAPRNAGEHYITRYEQDLIQENAAKDSKIALLESNIYVDGKIAEVYERLNAKIGIVENQLCEQKVYNATLNGVVSCIQGQIAALQALTKNVIPLANICPQPTTTTTTGA